jgi:hypothetical protein
MTGGWTKLHKEEHHKLCSLPGTSRVVRSRRRRRAFHRAQMRKKKIACTFLMANPKRKRPLGRPR